MFMSSVTETNTFVLGKQGEAVFALDYWQRPQLSPLDVHGEAERNVIPPSP
jgi:hypothetical protein